MRIVTTSVLTIVLIGWMLSSGAIGAVQTDKAADKAAEEEKQFLALPITREMSFDFEQDDDRNYDRWPDRWTRRQGTGYPHYVKIGIEPRELGDADQGNCLRIQLDGGAAEVKSPRQRIDARFSYYLEAEIRTFETDTKELNEAWITVEFRDSKSRLVSRYASSRLQHCGDFQRVRIGPMIHPDGMDCSAQVVLHVAPTRASDLFGGACFDQIELIPYPKLLVETNQPYNIFSPSEPARVTCLISGVQEKNARLSFQLYDPFGEPIGDCDSRALIDALDKKEAEVLPTDAAPFDPLFDQVPRDEIDLKSQITVEWLPPVRGEGFYQAKIRLTSEGKTRLERSLTLAVIDANTPLGDSHFGWTLPAQDSSVQLPQLTELLRHSAVRWVKYPVWYGKSDAAAAEWIAEFAERLASMGIEFVGMLDFPPEEHLDAFNRTDHGIASLLREPELWQPTLNHVLARLSLKVHWWQLGADDDFSFVGYPDVVKKIQEIRFTLARYAKDMKLGLTWQWLHFMPINDELPWDFALHVAKPELTSDELESYLMMDGVDRSKIWTTIQPLPTSQYSLQTRIRDLVSRMVQVKIAQTTAFVVEPFSDERGLMRNDGTPGALFVPWRTTSLQLAGKDYIGRIQLPNGSENFIFSDGESATMLVWNDRPVTETLYLGEAPQVTDIWGHTVSLESDRQGQHLQVSPWPQFVSGLEPNVAKFRMNLRFDRNTLASIFGQRQTAGILFDNVFPRGASGTLFLHSDELWAKPIELPFKVSSGEKFAREFPIVLRSFASTGRHPVRIDVVIDADQRYRFSVFREIQVGYGKVELEHLVEKQGDHTYRVFATLVNNSYDTVNFDCSLLVPGQRKQRKQVLRLGHGRETLEFLVVGNAQRPIESIWIRAEEIRGNRVLNHHFKVVDPTDDVSP